MKILKSAIFLLMIAGLILFIVGITLKVPTDHLTYYSYDSASHIDQYVGGDAYNYIIGANLVGAKITGVMIQKAIFIVAGLFLFFFSVFSLAFVQIAKDLYVVTKGKPPIDTEDLPEI